MSQVMEPRPADGVDNGAASRSEVLAALHGAARRGWLGPTAAAGLASKAERDGFERLMRIDRLALAIKSALDSVGLPLARAARALAEARGWNLFGYARVEDYARERLGRTGRWLRGQVSLGRSLESFPALVAAMVGADGGRSLGKVGASLVGRVASPQSVGAWIELARNISVRELNEIVKQALRSGSDAPPREGEPVPEGAGSTGDGCVDGFACGEETDLEEHRRVCMAVPIPVRAAFDETLVLHRCVSGRETSVTSFVEALVAEAHAGPRPPDVDSVSFRPGRGAAAAVERELARRTGLWACLREHSEPGSSSALAADALARFERLSRRAGRGSAVELDRQIRELVDLEDELERRLGQLLRELDTRGAWARLSFAGLRHYAEQRLGLGRSAVEARARVARGLEYYPQLRRAYEQGRVGLESALIVVRVLKGFGVDPALERAWVERAAEATVKRIRDEARVMGRRRARGEVTSPPMPLDDAAWHASLAQPPGKIRARLGELADRAVASPRSDSFLRLTMPAELAHMFLAAVESARRGLEGDAGASPLSVADTVGDTRGAGRAAAASTRAARTFSAGRRTVPSWVGLLALLEDFVETWDMPEAIPARRSDQVYTREGWRCFAPGCTGRSNLEDHHLIYRSRGGDAKAMSNRTCLCSFHHRRGEHGDLAACRGEAPLGVQWRLGRKDVGVWFRNERKTNGGVRDATLAWGSA